MRLDTTAAAAGVATDGTCTRAPCDRSHCRRGEWGLGVGLTLCNCLMPLPHLCNIHEVLGAPHECRAYEVVSHLVSPAE